MINTRKLLGNNRRTALMRKNILTSFILKGWSGLVFLLIVPITLKCLGTYDNGVWLTISSMLVWLDNMDIGLGNGLRNKLAGYLAHDDLKKARTAVSSTFFMLIIIIIPATFLLIGAVHVIDLYGLLNVDPDKVPNLLDIVTVSVLLVCSTFIFKFIGNFYLGLQLPAVNNLLITTGHTLILGFTWLAYLINAHSLMVIAVINTATPLFVYILAYPITFGIKYKKLSPKMTLFDKRMVGELFNIGLKFFVLQISAAIMFLSSNILISHLYTPSMVTPYQIAYRYFSIVLILFSVICAPLWTATTDAYERGDMEWVKQTEHRMAKILLAIGILLLVMVLASKLVYTVWIGKDVEISFNLTILMAVYICILIYCTAYCYFLNGLGLLHLQLICTITGAVIFIPLTLWLSTMIHGVESILIAMCIANLPSLICNKLQFGKIIKGTAEGIWIKK